MDSGLRRLAWHGVGEGLDQKNHRPFPCCPKTNGPLVIDLFTPSKKPSFWVVLNTVILSCYYYQTQYIYSLKFIIFNKKIN